MIIRVLVSLVLKHVGNAREALLFVHNAKMKAYFFMLKVENASINAQKANMLIYLQSSVWIAHFLAKHAQIKLTVLIAIKIVVQKCFGIMEFVIYHVQLIL